MKKITKHLLGLALIMALAISCIGLAHSDVMASAEGEVVLNNTVDLRETGLALLPVNEDSSKTTLEASDVYNYIYSYGGTVGISSNRPYLDTVDDYFVFKLIVPKGTTYVAGGAMSHVKSGSFSASPDGKQWTELYRNFDWAIDGVVGEANNLADYLNKGESEEYDVVYVRFGKTDALPQAPIFNIITFSCGLTPDLSAEHAALTEEKTAGEFDVFSEEESNYLIALDGNQNESFRFFDALPHAGEYKTLALQFSGHMWSDAGYYKFTYSDKAEGLVLRAHVSNNYYVGVAKTLDEKTYITDGVPNYGPRCELTLASHWTTAAIGSGDAELEIDISSLMEDNENNTIYVKIADGSPVYGQGGCLYSMGLYEIYTAEAPVVTATDSAAYVGDSLDVSTLFSVVTADDNASYEYTVDGKVLENLNLELAEAGTVSVKLTVTDANGKSGEATAAVTVSEKVVEPDDSTSGNSGGCNGGSGCNGGMSGMLGAFGTLLLLAGAAAIKRRA